MNRRTCPRCGGPSATFDHCWRCGTPSTPADYPSHPHDLHVAELHGYGPRNLPVQVEVKHHFGWTLHAPGPSDLAGAAYLGALQVMPWLVDRPHMWRLGSYQSRHGGTIMIEHAEDDGRPRNDPDRYWMSDTYRRYFPHGTLARGPDGGLWVFAEHSRSEHQTGCTYSNGKWRRADDPFFSTLVGDIPGPDWILGVEGDGQRDARLSLVIDFHWLDLQCARNAWLGVETKRQAWSRRHGASKITVAEAGYRESRALGRFVARYHDARDGVEHDWDAHDGARATPEEVWEVLGVRARLDAERVARRRAA